MPLSHRGVAIARISSHVDDPGIGVFGEDTVGVVLGVEGLVATWPADSLSVVLVKG
jgi:hypothetical protein